MARKPAEKLFPFQVQFSLVDSVDADAGTLMGVTVAEIGTATGHFAFLDRDGRVLGTGGVDDRPQAAARMLPLCMDEKSLESLVACAKATGRIKTREDHDDSVGARAGHTENFRIVGDKAVCDMKVLENYRNRGVFLETASTTPELIGLSGDMGFNIEIIGECAFMRVGKINAVDIVDRGALTHAGLFSAKASTDAPPAWPSVDNTKKTNRALVPNPATITTMSAKTAVSSNDIPDVDQFVESCGKMGEYLAGHNEHVGKIHEALKGLMAGIDPVKVPTGEDAPAPVTGKPGNPDASIPDPAAAFKAELKELKDAMTAMKGGTEEAIKAAAKAAVVEAQKGAAALGIKASAAPSSTPADTAKPNGEAKGATAGEPTTYKGWAEKFAADRKVHIAEAYRLVAREMPDVYSKHVLSLGQRN